MIKPINSPEDIKATVTVLRKSFATVANRLGLTVENCPTNAAFIKEESLYEMKEKGIFMFGLFDGDEQVGFTALQKSTDTLFYLEKLAVIPEYRHKGYGKILMDFCFDYVRKLNGEKISIGIINENTVLKNWYSEYGFTETGTKDYPHLPFIVCFMEKSV